MKQALLSTDKRFDSCLNSNVARSNSNSSIKHDNDDKGEQIENKVEEHEESQYKCLKRNARNFKSTMISINDKPISTEDKMINIINKNMDEQEENKEKEDDKNNNDINCKMNCYKNHNDCNESCEMKQENEKIFEENDKEIKQKQDILETKHTLPSYSSSLFVVGNNLSTNNNEQYNNNNNNNNNNVDQIKNIHRKSSNFSSSNIEQIINDSDMFVCDIGRKKNLCNEELNYSKIMSNQLKNPSKPHACFSIFVDPQEKDNKSRRCDEKCSNNFYYANVKRTESFHDKITRVFKGNFKYKHKQICSVPPTQQRFSILGQPLPEPKPVRFLAQKAAIYNFLLRPRGSISYCYHIFLGFMIVLALILFALTTVPSMKKWSDLILRYLDLVIFKFLLIEIIVLFWSSSCVIKYQNFSGKLRFLISPFRILDICVIASTGIVLYLHWFAENREQHIRFGWLRSLQIVQILRLENRFKAWLLLGSVIWLQRKHLLIISYMAFLILIIISYIVYFFEQRDPNTPFINIPMSLWWGLISIMTIGYGDIVPVTPEGKIVGGIMTIAGVIIYAIPAGIIATGLALKVQENDRQKHISKRTIPASKLIQTAWRCYVASKNSRSEVTWRSAIEYINKNCINKKKQKKHSEWSLRKSSFDTNKSYQSKHHHNYGTARFYLIDENDENTSQYSTQNSQADLYKINNNFTLSDTQKNAILFLRKIKFSIALKEFKNAFKPYDIQDVLQQYSEGHSDVIGRVRVMQDRVNNVEHCLGSISKILTDVNRSQDKKFDMFNKKIDSLIRLLEIQNRQFSNVSSLNSVEKQIKQNNCKSTLCSQTSMIGSDFYEFYDSQLLSSSFNNERCLHHHNNNNNNNNNHHHHRHSKDIIKSNHSSSSFKSTYIYKRRHSFGR